MDKTAKYNKKISVNLIPAQFFLTFVFALLKLFGFVTWSWWWVTAPIWLPLVLSWTVSLLFLAMFLFSGILAAILLHTKGPR